jgi:photosystem II stability/assembly factor-like uncharacterized protein
LSYKAARSLSFAKVLEGEVIHFNRIGIGAVIAAAAAWSSLVWAADDVTTFERLPIVSAQTKAAGFIGGEGSQWPRDVAISAADPSFMMFLTDVGGIYRSLDAGRTWNISMHGYHARGGSSVALDPRNADRLLVVAGYSGDQDNKTLGLYQSADRGASWTQRLPMNDANGGLITYDPSSYDASAGFCKMAYYASPDSGLFRSDDGGATWALVNDKVCRSNKQGPELGQQKIAVNPAGGEVLLARDAGKTFERISNRPTAGLAVAGPKQPNTVWISDDQGIKKSTDAGRTFNVINGHGLPAAPNALHDISISPADPLRISVWNLGDNYRWDRFVSWDGGETFSPVRIDAANAILPQNGRQGIVSWHPTDPNTALSIGGDWATLSRDGGKTYQWASNGENAIMVGGMFNFSLKNPDCVALFFQDYNGASTRDGGKTWTYHDVSGRGWGGWDYGAFTFDGRTIFGGDANGWYEKRHIRISHDGGATWQTPKQDGQPLTFTGADASYATPDGRVLFCSNFRSVDNGNTWKSMTDCAGVFGHTMADDTAELFGIAADRKAAVVSRDGGETWTRASAISSGDIRDIARDPKRARWYASIDRTLWICSDKGEWTKVESLPRDFLGNAFIHSVAVDPVNPQIVYAGGAANQYLTENSLFRSLDGGRTWKSLTDVGPGGLTPHEIDCVRVNPRTRDLWISGQCFGMWLLKAPAAGNQ